MILVVGCGNELRGDDAAGPRLARQVAEWKVPGVRVRDVQQLLPELADEFARADRVIVIDASAEEQGSAVEFRALEPRAGPQALGHVGDVPWLLAVARELFGRAPPCTLVALRAEQFELGAPLSEGMRAAMDEALEQLRWSLCVAPPRRAMATSAAAAR